MHSAEQRYITCILEYSTHLTSAQRRQAQCPTAPHSPTPGPPPAPCTAPPPSSTRSRRRSCSASARRSRSSRTWCSSATSAPPWRNRWSCWRRSSARWPMARKVSSAPRACRTLAGQSDVCVSARQLSPTSSQTGRTCSAQSQWHRVSPAAPPPPPRPLTPSPQLLSTARKAAQACGRQRPLRAAARARPGALSTSRRREGPHANHARPHTHPALPEHGKHPLIGRQAVYMAAHPACAPLLPLGAGGRLSRVSPGGVYAR